MKFRLGQIAVMLMAITAPWATYTTVLGVLVPLYLSFMLVIATFARSMSGERVYFGRPMIALLVYVGLIGLSVFWSLTASAWALSYNLTSWTNYMLAFFGVINFLRDTPSLRRFAYAAVVGALVTLPQLAPYEVVEGVTGARYAVKGHNANFTAYVLAGAFFVMALSMRYLRHSTVTKLALLGGMAAVGIGLSLLDTRGAQLSVLLSGLTIFGGKLVTKSAARLASALAILAAVAFSLGWLTPFLVWIDSMSARSTGDLSGRVLIWVDALRYIMERPIFGIGPGSFVELGVFKVGVHNVFLLVLLDTGIVGLGVFFWFLFEVWRSIVTLGRDGQRIFFAFLMYWLPMAISGHWETSAFSWGVVAFAINVARVLERDRMRSATAPSVMRAHGPVLQDARATQGPASTGGQIRV